MRIIFQVLILILCLTINSYALPPTYSFDPTNLTSAINSQTQGADIANQFSMSVKSITKNAAGTGYAAGTLVFAGCGGSGAAGTYTVAAGLIDVITVTSEGTGYTCAPTVTPSDAGNGDAILTSVMYGNSLKINGVSINEAGTAPFTVTKTFRTTSSAGAWFTTTYDVPPTVSVASQEVVFSSLYFTKGTLLGSNSAWGSFTRWEPSLDTDDTVLEDIHTGSFIGVRLNGDITTADFTVTGGVYSLRILPLMVDSVSAASVVTLANSGGIKFYDPTGNMTRIDTSLNFSQLEIDDIVNGNNATNKAAIWFKGDGANNRLAFGSTMQYSVNRNATTQALDFTETLTAADGNDTFNMINFAMTNANHTGTGNTVNVINIPAMTGDANSNFNAINIGAFTGTTGAASEIENGITVGTGFDNALSLGGKMIFTADQNGATGEAQITRTAANGLTFYGETGSVVDVGLINRAGTLSFGIEANGSRTVFGKNTDYSATPQTSSDRVNRWNYWGSTLIDATGAWAGTCNGATANCITLPIAGRTGGGFCRVWDGTLALKATFFVSDDGSVTADTSSGLIEIGARTTCPDGGATNLNVCIFDGGTNAILVNDTGGAKTLYMTCETTSG